MPKLSLTDPRLPYNKLNDEIEYWELQPPFETTHLLLARFPPGSRTSVNCNTGSIIVVVEGTIWLEVNRPLDVNTTESLSPGEGYLFADETAAWAKTPNDKPAILVVLRAGGPGGHPNTNRPLVAIVP